MRSLYDGDFSGSLSSQVRASALPMLLMQLQTHKITAASQSAADLFLRPDADPSDLVGSRWPDLTADAATTNRLLQQLSEGEIDGYQRTMRVMRRSGRETVNSRVVVQAHHLPGESPLAIAVLFAADEGERDELAQVENDGGAVVALLSDAGQFTHVTASVRTLLGHDPDDVIESRLLDNVHPDDVPELLFCLGHATAEGDSVWTQLRWRQAHGGWRLCRTAVCPLSSLSRSAFAFVILGHAWTAGEGLRELELEATLGRVAREIGTALARTPAAAGGGRSLALPQLTKREQEVVGRLLDGDRVPAIARMLFLSPSTVRNHLHAAYRKTGVHSQQELVDYLRETQA